MVGYQVDGPLWVVFGLSRGLCGRSSYDFGAPVGCLGPLLEPMLGVLAALGASVGGPGLP